MPFRSRTEDRFESVEFELGTLYYRTTQLNQWKRLPSLSNETFGWNLTLVMFDGNSISVTQKSRGTGCTLKLEKGRFKIGKVDLPPIIGRYEDSILAVNIQVNEEAKYIISSDSGAKGLIKAHEIPLAELGTQMKYIRLELFQDPHYCKVDGLTKPRTPYATLVILRKLCAAAAEQTDSVDLERTPESETHSSHDDAPQEAVVFLQKAVITPQNSTSNSTVQQFISTLAPQPPSSNIHVPAPISRSSSADSPQRHKAQKRTLAEISVEHKDIKKEEDEHNSVPPPISTLAPQHHSTDIQASAPVPSSPSATMAPHHQAAKRTLAEIDAAYEEIEKQEEDFLANCRERKKMLREERKGAE